MRLSGKTKTTGCYIRERIHPSHFVEMWFVVGVFWMEWLGSFVSSLNLIRGNVFIMFQSGPMETLIKTRGGQEQHYNMYKYCRNIQKLRWKPHILKQGFGSGSLYKALLWFGCWTQCDPTGLSIPLASLPMKMITSKKHCGTQGGIILCTPFKLHPQTPVLKLLMLLLLPQSSSFKGGNNMQ